jgi:lysophospholipase L1-like esterase
MVMKTILCYGDSITWGTNPETGGTRHAFADRWPNVLKAGLGDGYEVIAEGMGGRTTAFDDFLVDADRNGARLLPSIMHTHRPVDLVILMLGTNDMKPATAGNAASAMLGMRRCVEIAQHHVPRLPDYVPPKVIIVAPPHLVETTDGFFAELFAGGIAESKKLARYYAGLAIQLDCAFVDASRVAKASPIDGIHLDAANTRALGAALVPRVKELLET